MTKLDLLPPPNLGRLLSRMRPSTLLLAFCDFAEGYLQEETPGRLPRRWNGPRSRVGAGLWVRLRVGLAFYGRFKNTPKEQDTPDRYPKGVKALVEQERARVRHTIDLIRGEKWATYIEEEYEAAFDRCAKLCAAVRLGHWPGPNNPIVFSREDVEKTMLHSKEAEVGVVDFSHIYRVLLSQAEPE